VGSSGDRPVDEFSLGLVFWCVFHVCGPPNTE
jgi:hypothetical protein